MKHFEMKLVAMYKDAFGNTATITKESFLPYRGATKAVSGYKLSCTADYDFDYLHFVSIYETLEEAVNQMKCFSGNTWKEVNYA